MGRMERRSGREGRWLRVVGVLLNLTAGLLLANMVGDWFGSYGLRPGWEWTRIYRAYAALASLPLAGIGLTLLAFGWRTGLPTVSAGRSPLLFLAGLFVVGTILSFGLCMVVIRFKPPTRLYRLDAPAGREAVVELRGGMSPDARLWMGPGPLSPNSPRFEVGLWCDGRPDLRRSPRRGRSLVCDRQGIVGGIIDLNVPSFVVDPRRFPPIEELRAEFGENLWFPVPDWIDEPLEPDE